MKTNEIFANKIKRYYTIFYMIAKQKNKNLFEQYGDLFRKIGFTLFILALYKIISYIVIPGVNIEILSSVVNSNSILKSLDLFKLFEMKEFNLFSATNNNNNQSNVSPLLSPQ